jgi:enamine deaminase RidA (YjgF/YER057c/UK114 family)
MTTEARLKELGIELPTPPSPVANYVPAVRTGNLVYLSGNGPRQADGTNITGKLGAGMSIEDGYKAARLVGLNLLANLKAEIGTLDRVTRVVKLLAMVNSAPDFGEQPQVANGVSDLLVEVFGDKGKHARSAVGMGSLPGGIPVEVEMIVEVQA